MKNTKAAGILARIFFAVSSVASALLALTVSIAVPIYVRPFYYAEINALGICESTGYSYDTVKNAYDEVLDYLTAGGEFGTGELRWSEEGRMHFADCKVLFDLNITVMLISALAVVLVCVLSRLLQTPRVLAGGHFRPSFFGGTAALVLPSVFAVYAAADFDSAFTLFHRLFFPGKTNWVFDPRTDEIIRILPEEFFAACACLIGAALLIICAVMIITGIVRKKKYS